MTDTYQPSQLGTPGASLPSRPVTPTPAPATGGYQASFGGAYSPAQIHSALINAGASPNDATTLTAVSGAESRFGASPVSPPNKNGSRDHGVFQVNDKAWPQFGGAAVSKLPLDQQAAIAVYIKNHQGMSAWSTYNSGAYKKYLNQVGSTTAPASSAPAAAPTTNELGVGAALAALNSPGSSGQSTMQNLQSMLGQQQPDNSRAPDPGQGLQLQQAAGMGNVRQQQIAQQAAQMAAQLRQQAGQPLAWSSAPFGSTAGSQRTPTTMVSAGGQLIPTPGTTLNSMGYGYV